MKKSEMIKEIISQIEEMGVIYIKGDIVITLDDPEIYITDIGDGSTFAKKCGGACVWTIQEAAKEIEKEAVIELVKNYVNNHA